MPYLDPEADWANVPDLVVADVAYQYTGLRDSRGHKILRRVSNPIGFLGKATREYASDVQDQQEVTRDELYESEGLDG